MDLLMLAPEIQEEVLFGGLDLRLLELMPIVQRAAWVDQRAMWRRLGVVRPAA